MAENRKRAWDHCATRSDEDGYGIRWSDWCARCRAAFLREPVKPSRGGRHAAWAPTLPVESWPTPGL